MFWCCGLPWTNEAFWLILVLQRKMQNWVINTAYPREKRQTRMIKAMLKGLKTLKLDLKFCLFICLRSSCNSLHVLVHFKNTPWFFSLKKCLWFSPRKHMIVNHSIQNIIKKKKKNQNKTHFKLLRLSSIFLKILIGLKKHPKLDLISLMKTEMRTKDNLNLNFVIERT